MEKLLKCTIEAKNTLDENEEKRVLEINKSNLAKNGGELHYEGILDHDIVVLVKYKQVVIGYALLKKAFLDENDIYVMQVAIDNNFKHLGIGTNMYDYAYKHLKNYKYFTANVNPDNKISKNFHKKCGFKLIGENNLGLVYLKTIENVVKLDFTSAQKETFVFKNPKFKKFDLEK